MARKDSITISQRERHRLTDSARYYRRRILEGMSSVEAKRQNVETRRALDRAYRARFRAAWGEQRDPGAIYIRRLGKHLGLKNRGEVIEYLSRNKAPEFID